MFTHFSYIVSVRCLGLGVFFLQYTKDCFSFNDFVKGKRSFCFLVRKAANDGRYFACTHYFIYLLTILVYFALLLFWMSNMESKKLREQIKKNLLETKNKKNRDDWDSKLTPTSLET